MTNKTIFSPTFISQLLSVILRP